MRTVKKLLSTPERPFQINHVVTVDFRGFRAVIDYIGCVYVDIDRDYFNDVGGPGGYATIDIDPGYQKLCGKDSLDYVRYRHGDNDLVRAARQQDFLRQIRNQHGIRRLSSPAPSNLRKLARIFARYFDSDKGLRQKKQIFGLAKTVLFTSANPVREVRFRVSDAGDGINLVASPDAAQGDGGRVPQRARLGHAAHGVGADGRGARLAAPARAARCSPPPSRGSRRRAPRARTRRSSAARKIDFPFYFPTVRTSGSGYVGQAPRIYTVRDELGRKHDAYRMVDRQEHRRRVLRHPGDDLARPADPRRPRRGRRPQRPQAAHLPRRAADPARGVAHAQGASTGSPTRSRSRSRGRRCSASRRRCAASARAGTSRRRGRRPGEPRAGASRAASLSARMRDGTATREPIGVIGTGYVGLVTAAGFAALGSDVFCVDIDEAQDPRASRGGRMPIWEPGLAELVAEHRDRLHFSTDLAPALEHARLLFVAVGTPPTYSGDADLSAVHAVVDAMPASDAPRARDEVHGAGRHRGEHQARVRRAGQGLRATCRAPSSSRRAARSRTSSSPTAW